MRRAALPLLLLCVTAAEARAECMAPQAVVFPLGSAVGPNPVLYRFATRWDADQPLRIEHPDGRPASFTARDVSTPGADIRVTRIEMHIAGDFVVHPGEYAVPRTYQLWPKDNPPWLAVEDVRWVQDAWTCSHTKGLQVSLRGGSIAAIRARWSDGFEAIVPPSDRAFFHHAAMGGEIDPSQLRILLGHPNCVANVIPDRYIERMDVELTAIFSDGQEREVPLRRKAAPPEPPEVCVIYPSQLSPPPSPTSSPSRTPWWIAGAAALGGLVTVALVLLVRRRRVTAIP